MTSIESTENHRSNQRERRAVSMSLYGQKNNKQGKATGLRTYIVDDDVDVIIFRIEFLRKRKKNDVVNFFLCVLLVASQLW